MLGTDYAICIAFVGVLVTDAAKSSSQQQVYMEANVAKVVCHNLDHEALVLCRELQNPNESVTFCKGPFALILLACTVPAPCGAQIQSIRRWF